MECKEFEKRIPDFIKRRLDYVTLKAFAEHMGGCSKCREEMTIQFLIDEGLIRLEEGSAFDLNSELRMRLQEAEKKIHRNDLVISVGTVFEYIIMTAIVVIVFSIIFV